LKKRKLFFTLLKPSAVFLISYIIVFAIIVFTPLGNLRQQVYSSPNTSLPFNSSYLGGAWEDQMLWLGPSPGSTGVPRDTVIWIGEPRPVGVKNLTLSPQAGILKIAGSISVTSLI
jgi:hypothetical protein